MTTNSEEIRVLVVDDDAVLRRSLERVLEEKDLIVETASCAAEANVFLNKSQFDVVLCDYNMPGQNGLEFLSDLPKHHPDVIRMVLSGQVSGFEVAEKWAYDIGVYDIFSKPFDAEKIACRIRLAIFKRENSKMDALAKREENEY